MKILKRSVTIALLLFVGATVGMLVAQEVSYTNTAPNEDVRISDAPEGTEPVAVRKPVEQVGASGEERAPVAAEVSSRPDLEHKESEPSSAAIEETEPELTCVVDAIYFHNTLRCRTCKNIEETAKAVVEEAFAEEFGSGQLRWSAINMERQQHYVEEYDLVKPTLILVRTVGEEQSGWVALDETWSLIRSEVRFSDYVRNETRAFLEACL